MTDTTRAPDRTDHPAADQAVEETEEQTADAEASAEARTNGATSPSATTVDERDRTAAQPPGAGASAPPRGEAAPTNGEAALFDRDATRELQGRWQTIQVAFVDEPKGAVEQADRLVDDVLEQLQASFSREREELERAWSGGSEASTEDLRQAIRRYRSFFNRLLSI